jgi:PiT family inorganic phosphate transporter
MHSNLLVALVVATALAFDFTNGFHDTANVVATSISTRALSPRVAVALAALCNFAGAFISLKVAATIATGIVDLGSVSETTVFAGLVGAIVWNLATWYLGLPSSSSHALIGGVVGATIASRGLAAVQFGGLLGKVVIPAVLSPLLAFITAGLAIVLTYRLVARLRPGPANRGFRFGQILSGGMLARARNQRRPEDDGGHRAGARRRGRYLREALRGPRLGRDLCRLGNRARHLRRRLADHSHDGIDPPQLSLEIGLGHREQRVGWV